MVQKRKKKGGVSESSAYDLNRPSNFGPKYSKEHIDEISNTFSRAKAFSRSIIFVFIFLFVYILSDIQGFQERLRLVPEIYRKAYILLLLLLSISHMVYNAYHSSDRLLQTFSSIEDTKRFFAITLGFQAATGNLLAFMLVYVSGLVDQLSAEIQLVLDIFNKSTVSFILSVITTLTLNIVAAAIWDGLKSIFRKNQ